MFPLAAYIASFAGRKAWRILIIYTAAIAIIYAGGTAYLYFYMTHILGKTMTFKALVLAGILPFIPFDLLKMSVALPIHLRLSKLFSNTIKGSGTNE